MTTSVQEILYPFESFMTHCLQSCVYRLKRLVYSKVIDNEISMRIRYYRSSLENSSAMLGWQFSGRLYYGLNYQSCINRPILGISPSRFLTYSYVT